MKRCFKGLTRLLGNSKEHFKWINWLSFPIDELMISFFMFTRLGYSYANSMSNVKHVAVKYGKRGLNCDRKVTKMHRKNKISNIVATIQQITYKITNIVGFS